MTRMSFLNHFGNLICWTLFNLNLRYQRYINIISDIFDYGNEMLIKNATKTNESIEKIFNCLQNDLNPLAGGILCKIIKSMAQKRPKKIAGYVSKSCKDKISVFDLILLNINNLFAVDLALILLTNRKMDQQTHHKVLIETSLVVKLIAILQSPASLQSKKVIHYFDNILFLKNFPQEKRLFFTSTEANFWKCPRYFAKRWRSDFDRLSDWVLF